MSSVPFLPPLRPASYTPPPLPAPITSSLRRPSSFCFRPDARGSGQARVLATDSGPRRDACPRLLAQPPSIGLSPLEVPPPANLRCELRRASLGSKGAPTSPAIARTHMRRCACGGQPPTAQRMRLPSSRTQLPALPHKLHTPHSAPGCVAHTQWVPARCTGGARRYRGRTARVFFAATARAAFLLGDRLPTHSLTTAHGPCRHVTRHPVLHPQA